jgi:uncharacterized membrane protein
MDLVTELLRFVHLAAFVVALGSSVALLAAAPVIADGDQRQREALFRLGGKLGRNVNWGLLVLWVSGPLLVAFRYDLIAGLSHWFWMKMVFVVILSAAVGIGGAARKKMVLGDASAGPRARTAGLVGVTSGFGAILSAVFAFN